jgi:hypothetical protein
MYFIFIYENKRIDTFEIFLRSRRKVEEGERWRG